MTIIQQIYY